MIDEFNLLNEEKGLEGFTNIVDYQLGFGHDVVMIEDPEIEPIDIKDEYYKSIPERSIV